MLVYRGSVSLFADARRPYISEFARAELTATGGIMIVGIGINLLDLKKIRLSNLLPGLLIVIILCVITEYLQ